MDGKPVGFYFFVASSGLRLRGWCGPFDQEGKLFFLPSTREIEEALEKISEEGPVPLANLVDRLPSLRFTVEHVASHAQEVTTYVLVKSAFVAGLRLGMMIGERREKLSPGRTDGGSAKASTQ